MRATATAVLLASAIALASGAPPRVVGPKSRRGATVFRLLPAGGVQDCGGVAVGSFGETLTFTRATASLCIPSSGVATTVASGQPAVQPRGILSWRLRTNLFLRSDEIDNASWVDVGTPGTTGAAWTMPDNGVTGETITDNDGAAFEGETQTVAIATQDLYTCSWYVRAGTASTASLIITGTGNAAGNTTCNFSGLTATTTRIECPTAAAYGAGLTNVACAIRVGSVVGTTGTLNVGWAQLEVGGYASPYQETGAAALPRNADVARVATSSSWPVSGGTVCVTFTPGSAANYANSYIIDTRAAGNTNGVQVIRSIGAATQIMQIASFNSAGAGSFTEANSGALAWVAGQKYRICAKWGEGTTNANGSLWLWRDGVLIASRLGTASVPEALLANFPICGDVGLTGASNPDGECSDVAVYR